MRARVSSAIAAGTGLAFAGLGFTAVYREGFETVLFYQALALFAEGLMLWIALGALAAAIALVVVGYAILKLGKRLPLKPMLLTAAMLLLALSVAFVGNAVRSLQEGDWIGVTPVDGDWARLPIYLAELTGIHPTKEGLLTQAALLGIYVARRAPRVLRASGHAPRTRPSRARVTPRLRIGVDVGGTFTKAVAVSSSPLEVHARASVPTTHGARAGVAEGVAAALRELIAQLGEDRSRVELVAFSTTQAMNALLEGDVGTVGVVGIGYRPQLRVARKRTRVGDIGLAPRPQAGDAARVRRRERGRLGQLRSSDALDELVGRGATALAVSGAFAVDAPGRRGAVRAGGAGARHRSLRRARAHGRLRPGDADADGCDQREHPPDRRADGGDGGGSARGGRSSTCRCSCSAATVAR